MTANDERCIPEPILNRMNVFEIEAPSLGAGARRSRATCTRRSAASTAGAQRFDAGAGRRRAGPAGRTGAARDAPRADDRLRQRAAGRSAARSRRTTCPSRRRPRARSASCSKRAAAASAAGLAGRRVGSGGAPAAARRSNSQLRRCREHRVRVLRLAAAAVVAAQRHEQVAALAVDVVAQDHAAEAQVGLHVEQLAGIAVADHAGPERHHLHVAARAHRAHRELAEGALHLDQAQHQARCRGRRAGSRTRRSAGIPCAPASRPCACASRGLIAPSQRR